MRLLQARYGGYYEEIAQIYVAIFHSFLTVFFNYGKKCSAIQYYSCW